MIEYGGTGEVRLQMRGSVGIEQKIVARSKLRISKEGESRTWESKGNEKRAKAL